jgi:hypothetical protein
MPLINDPITVALNADGDDVLFPLRHLSGIDAVVQGIKVRLKTFRGEWFLNLDHGIPYLERDGVSEAEALLGQKFSEPKARSAFRPAILACPGVQEIVSLSITFDSATRTMTVEFSVRTEFGDSFVEEVEIG